MTFGHLVNTKKLTLESHVSNKIIGLLGKWFYEF